MTQREELKPCPFCGSAAEDGMGYNYHKVCCSSFACRMSNTYFTKKEWNMRAKAQAVPQWIPVNDPPKEIGRYWCYVEEQNDIGVSHYQWNCSWNCEEWGGEGLTGVVTHWMPLPSAPEQNK